jgi:DegV family protein with EDD domain
MENKIIVDSCTDVNDFTKDMFDTVPLKILIDDEEIVDDNLDINFLLEKIKKSKFSLKTACPSPGEYYEAIKKYKTSFIVTLSDKLSGSYNSAITACKMLAENLPESFAHVFNSKSASVAQSLISIKINELINLNHTKEEIITTTEAYIEKLKTMFILESYEHLAKAGRLSKIKASFAAFLHICPIMGANKVGEIEVLDKVRGKKRAFDRLIQLIGEHEVDFENTILGITHVNAIEKAQNLKNEILKKYPFKEVMIFEARGISTVYADDSGIVIAF